MEITGNNHNDLNAFASNETQHNRFSVLSNLELAEVDSRMQGLAGLFGEEEDSSDNGSDGGQGFCPIGMEEYELQVNDEITLSLIQATAAFTGVGSDETGGVLWGASVCLSQFLSREMVEGKRTLELGCGGGVPSLVACKYGAATVVATDFESATLQHMDYHAHTNLCEKIDVRQVDWGHLDPNDDYRADVILASDVVYGISQVPVLVKTIQHYLAPGGNVYIATRDGRRGVAEFRAAMAIAEFIEVDTIPCRREGNDAPPIFQSESNILRWRGDHSVHHFRRAGDAVSIS